jgi:hypothetical protein
MWRKVAISSIVTLGICNLTATRSDAMIYSPGMGKSGLELRQATTTFEPTRVGRASSTRTTQGVPRHSSRTHPQGSQR